MQKERKPEQQEQHGAHFFRGGELFWLRVTSPSRFVASLPESHLFVHIVGAAWDSFYALNNPAKAASFIEILKSDRWEKDWLKEGKVEPTKQAEITIAFLMENDGVKYDQQSGFIEFLREQEIMISKKRVDKYAKKIRKNNASRGEQ